MISDISPLNVAGLLKRNTARGPSVDDDSAAIATASVYEIDSARGRVRVGIRGGDVWLPAVADRYSRSSLARVLLDPTSSRPVQVLGAVRPRSSAELAEVTATGAGNVTVTVLDASYTIPAPIGTFTVGQSAWVLLDSWGAPVIAIGPATVAPTPAPATPPPPAVATTVTARAFITPQVSGTYRPGYGWNGWFGTGGAGSSDIFQGDAYGSGALQGFAGYGNQVANLRALSIESITLRVRKNSDGNASNLVVRTSALGSRPAGAPSSFGDSASSGTIPSGQWGTVAFTAAMREAFRTGAAKGLAAIGSQYGGFGGTARPGSFLLQIRYTKNA